MNNNPNNEHPYGLSWSLEIPSIAHQTNKKIPEYRGDEDSDVSVLSGAKDLVPKLQKDEMDK